ncbi:hypothetical protein CB0940_09193 [Cercospora beticola]|uniref:Uncharacterized protein n=1 Tax=Cercospora beticola TaxID=122368 RepID=A0A2G5HGX1_CERBT|nr:hypothetical protein CB0940_09193 [Cercospora beticola]PIA91787.1 hypothetical protein CB0940_09193 [Cercospora beticola]WPB06513.1 hypothetical protein RHO25_011170 [Cercospora beticola]
MEELADITKNSTEVTTVANGIRGPAEAFANALTLRDGLKGVLSLTEKSAQDVSSRKRSLSTRQEIPKECEGLIDLELQECLEGVLSSSGTTAPIRRADIPIECEGLVDLELQECIDNLVPSSAGTPPIRRQVPTFSTEEQQDVCDAFDYYVTVTQALMTSVTSKKQLLSQTPHFGTIGDLLRGLEDAADVLAFGLIEHVPTCSADATADRKKLGKTLGAAAKAFHS